VLIAALTNRPQINKKNMIKEAYLLIFDVNQNQSLAGNKAWSTVRESR
jgi:hypothetical protein